MKYAWPTLMYFLKWGTYYGLVLGTWSTTVMYPLAGTVFGIFWGGGIGAACGLICGLIVSVIQAYTFHPDVDLDLYRWRLSRGLGVLVAVIAPLLLVATSKTILWRDYDRYSFSSGFEGFLAPCLVAAAFWGGLAAAYVAHGYPVFLVHRIMNTDDPSASTKAIDKVAEAIFQEGLGCLIFALGAGIGATAGLLETLNNDVYRAKPLENVILRGGLGVACGVFLCAMLIWLTTFGAAALIVFLKRLLFSDDSLRTSTHSQRLILTVSATALTGLVCGWPFIAIPAINWLWAPILYALVMGFYVYRALPFYDKDKRKEARQPENPA